MSHTLRKSIQTRFVVLLILSFAPAVCENAVVRGGAVDEPSTDAEQKPAVEMVRRVRVDRMRKLVDDAIANNKIVTDLGISIGKNEVLFDVTLQPHPANTPWLILLNMTDKKYSEACTQYGQDGYQRLVDRFIVIDGKTFHSVVWFQPVLSDTTPTLQIPPGPLPESGPVEACCESLDHMMRTVLREHNIPGATIAVSKDGRIFYARGFGYQEVASATSRSFFSQTMSPESEMRIASISKPITATAVLQLVERGQLSLDQSVLELLTANGYPGLSDDADPRWKSITVRDLLHHSGGWDSRASKDPMFQVIEITQESRLRKPARQLDIIRYQLNRPLDFDPGSRHAYSNFGYCLLGRIIEFVSLEHYEDFVRRNILEPAAMEHTRLGKTRQAARGENEVRYHTQKLAEFPAFWEVRGGTRRKTLPETVPEPYGRWDLEVMDSHGGWVSTAPDLLRFVAALERTEQPLLKPETRRLMFAPPKFDEAADPAAWYGCGWNVRAASDGPLPTIWHIGELAGTSTLLVRRSDGFASAVLFNINLAKDGTRVSDIVNQLVPLAISQIRDIPSGPEKAND